MFDDLVVLIVNESSMRFARLGIEVLHESRNYAYTDAPKTTPSYGTHLSLSLALKRGLIACFFLAEKRVNLSTVLAGVNPFYWQ